jgi:hypothetical protein
MSKEKPNGVNQDNQKTFVQKEYGDFLSVYKGATQMGSDIVQQAASVMESEISSVIKVAKHVEDHSMVGERLRTEKPDELVQKFRRDAHEVLDIFVDVFAVALKTANNAANVIVIRGNDPAKPEQVVSCPRSVITAPQTVKPGEWAEFPISFENSSNLPTAEFNLFATDLISDSGSRIAATQIKFNPAAVAIGAHQTEKVIVTVAVPKETTLGTYTGLVLAANMNQLRSEIILKVE